MSNWWVPLDFDIFVYTITELFRNWTTHRTVGQSILKSGPRNYHCGTQLGATNTTVQQKQQTVYCTSTCNVSSCPFFKPFFKKYDKPKTKLNEIQPNLIRLFFINKENIIKIINSLKTKKLTGNDEFTTNLNQKLCEWSINSI